METFLWVLFVLTAGYFVYFVVVASRRARTGEPTPTYDAGRISAAAAMLLLIGVHLVGVNSRIGLSLLLAACVLIMASLVQYVRAWRRARVP